MKSPFTCRVLYAESHEDSSVLMKVLLGFADIEVVTAKTVAEARLQAQFEYFDLFILGTQFSDGDGLELCRHLRQRFHRTPIFFYSGKAYEIDKKNGLNAGADEYLIKPHSENLPEKILSAVSLSKTNEERHLKNTLLNLQNVEQIRSANRILEIAAKTAETQSKAMGFIN